MNFLDWRRGKGGGSHHCENSFNKGVNEFYRMRDVMTSSFLRTWMHGLQFVRRTTWSDRAPFNTHKVRQVWLDQI